LTDTVPGCRRRRRALLGTLVATVLLAAAVPAHASTAPPATPCPAVLLGKATCYSGQDGNGAYYTIAVPKQWNRSLVVHAHGGPAMSYDPTTTTTDLAEWAVLVEEGYAWAASSYRRGGYGVRMAAADTENVRRLFAGWFGRPGRTYVHGQSFGGNVAAKVAETYGAYDGVLLTSGLLAGGSRGYDHRVDLRVVYQYYCRNLPRPAEPRYPLWQGLPVDSPLTPDDVLARLQECIGTAGDRTPAQRRHLDDITAVTRIPERSLPTHLLYATFLFQEIVGNRLGGRNPFANESVWYSGSHDDRALNAGVARFAADPAARRDLSYDSDLTGRVPVPVLTLHAIDDPSVFVEHEAAYRETLRGAGQDGHLVQTFTRESEHDELSTAEYATSLAALDTWVRTGRKPDPGSIASSCGKFDGTYGGGCFYDPGYRPSPYFTRIRPRPGQTSWPAMTAARERAWSRIDGVGIAP
jgi:dienelactone hydrolase